MPAHTPKPVLTFKDGKFIATDEDGKAAHLFNSEFWETQSPGKYATTDLKAAVRIRAFADEAAEKILQRALVKHYSLPPLRLPLFLDPHQKAGVRWILTRSRSYLAHAPGAGKTAQAVAAAMLIPARGQVLFVVPPSLTVNWEREIAKFYVLITADPNARSWKAAARPDWGLWPSVSVIPESWRQEFTGWDSEFIVCPDSMLAKPWVLAGLAGRTWRLVAADEASRFKEPTSQRTIALFGGKLNAPRGSKSLRSPGLIQGARHAVLLDGSPMPNRPMELWAPTYAMHPEAIDCMNQQDFGFRYCGARINDYGRWEFHHASNQEELREKLRKDFMHVVTEDELSHPERRRAMLLMNKDVPGT
jgi:SWI/SNF-related matrix-associated actin-dependent regulator 1 of chromatin subfamily A